MEMVNIHYHYIAVLLLNLLKITKNLEKAFKIVKYNTVPATYTGFLKASLLHVIGNRRKCELQRNHFLFTFMCLFNPAVYCYEQ